MSKDELAEQAKRKPDTVKKWLQAGKRARIMESAAALGTKVPARTSQGFERKIGFGSGIKVYLPLLCTTFLMALEKAITIDRKKVPFSICVKTFEQVAREVYPEGVVHKDVKDYVTAYYGLDYDRIRSLKQQRVVSHQAAQPGRHLLTRILSDGLFSFNRCGGGKQRADVLEGSSDTWEKSVGFYRRAIDHHKMKLESICDVDEMCLFWCGHIGWMRHSHAISHAAGKKKKSAHKQDFGYRKT